MVEALESRRLLAATIPTDINNTANAVREAAAVGTTVGITASSTGTGAVTYSLSDDAGGRFGINATTGVVAVANGSLLDGPASHAITVVASDGAGTASQSFTIAVNNVAPAAKVSSGKASASEGGAYTVDLSSSDPGSDTVSSWTIDWGDGSPPQVIPGNPATATHVYPDGRPRQLLGGTLLNEMKVNAPGPHGPYEYVELRGDPGSALQNLYFISIEGDADPEPNEPLGPGTVEMVVALGGHSFGASGLLVIKGTQPGHAIPADTTVVTSVSLDTPGKALENGSNSFLIVSSPTPIVDGTDYDTNNDGVLELPDGASVLDAVGWSDGGASDKVYGGVTLSQSSGVPEAATRFFGNTTANSAAAWYNGPLVGEADTVAYDLTRTSTNFPSDGGLTPGASNVPLNVLPPPRLNELKVDPPTTADAPFEYIELKGTPHQTLARLFLVVLESDVSASAAQGGLGRADMVVNLSGVSLGSNGLLMIKSEAGGHTPADGTAVLLDSQFNAPGSGTGNGLENGSISFLLVSSLSAIIEGNDYDTTNDGILDLPAGAVVADAVGWTDGEAGDVVYGGVVLQQAGGGAPHAATRLAHDSTPNSDAAWYNGMLAGTTAESLTYDLARVSANFPTGGALTPGADNVPPGTPPPVVFPSVNGYFISARVTDEDGTHKAIGLTVTVDDVAPTVAISGAASAAEGSPYSLTIGTAQDPGADTVSSYIVHWGDGSSDTYSAAGVVTHTYADGPNAYNITVDVVNEDGTFTNCANSLSVAVGDAAPTVAISGAASVSEGGTYNLTLGAAQDPGADTVTSYVVHWGDGSSNTYLAAGVVTHTYADGPNTFPVTVDVVNDDGTFANRANPLSVSVSDVAPTVTISGAASAAEGSPYSLTIGTAQDPGADTVSSYVVHWGDGSSNSYAAPGVVTHVFAEGPSAHNITVDVVNEDGTFANRANPLSVSVGDVAPTVTISGAGTASEGSAYSLTLGAAQDPGADTVSSYVVHWGDGSSNTYTAAGVVTHTYADGPNAYAITVDVVTEDGTFTDRANPQSVAVGDVPPTVTISGAASVAEGSPYSLTLGAAQDPGNDTASSYVVHWGDGSSSTYPASGVVTHVYADGPGTRAITVDVINEDGTFANRANPLSVAVADVAPTVAVSGAGSAAEGSAYTLTLGAAQDPGNDTVSSYVVHWGDGSSNAYTAPGDVTHVFADGPNAYTVTVEVVNEDGTFAANPLVVSVSDVAPTVAISGAGSVNAGETYSLTLGAAQDPGADTVSGYVVHWGDGTSDTYSAAGVVTHAFAGGLSPYSITVDVVNEEGPFTNCANPLSVTVLTAEPGLLAIDAAQAAVAVNEGQTATNTGTWSAPGAAAVTLTASIGTAVLNPDGTWSWSWGAADGPNQSQVVTITATDDGGGSTSVSFDVVVNNVAPSVSLSIKSSVNEGDTAVLHVVIVDPGVLDTHVLVVNWGEGAAETVQVPAGTTELKLTHRYLDDNPTATASDLYTIGVSLTDKDGANAVASATTTVRNVAADVQFRADDAARNALLRSFQGSFSDAGTLDTWTATVNFGDGTGDQLLTFNADGTFAFSHTYASAGSYDVVVTVTDDDGGSRQVKRKISIRN